jgi:hypothetical protein
MARDTPIFETLSARAMSSRVTGIGVDYLRRFKLL